MRQKRKGRGKGLALNVHSGELADRPDRRRGGQNCKPFHLIDQVDAKGMETGKVKVGGRGPRGFSSLVDLKSDEGKGGGAMNKMSADSPWSCWYLVLRLLKTAGVLMAGSGSTYIAPSSGVVMRSSRRRPSAAFPRWRVSGTERRGFFWDSSQGKKGVPGA